MKRLLTAALLGLSLVSCEKHDLVKEYEQRLEAMTSQPAAAFDEERQLAQDLFFAMKDSLHAKKSLLDAERRLKESRAPGLAELRSLDVQEAREKSRVADTQVQAKRKALFDHETEIGTYDDPERFTLMLDEFHRYADRIIFLQDLHQNQEMFPEVLKCAISIRFEEVEAGGYQAFELEDLTTINPSPPR